MLQLLFELRKKKGMTIEEARKLVTNPLYLGCLIIQEQAMPTVSWQVHAILPAILLRPALQIIKDCSGHYLRFRCYVVADACSRIW